MRSCVRTIREEFPRIWLTGALLAIGDALKENKYFDHAPELELVYHLRNGIAHGNCFEFTDPGRKRLAKYPAHNRDCFGITLALEGRPALFDFIEAATCSIFCFPSPTIWMNYGVERRRNQSSRPKRNV
ncbi:MAG: hypothetical protein J2P56_05435 [Verrucomicrobia bacterium]|nr:hypothetical protein [Verrucomicrobiota bacterium]